MTSFQFLKELFRRYPSGIAIVSVLLAVSTFLEAVGLATFLPLLNSVFSGSGETGGRVGEFLKMIGFQDLRVSNVLLLIVVVIALKGLTLYGSVLVTGKVGINICRDLKADLMKSILAADWNFHLEQKVGHTLNILTNETGSVMNAIKYVGLYYTNLVTVVGFLILSLFISWKMVIVGVFIGSITMIFMRRLIYHAKIIAERQVEVNNACNAIIVESMNNVKYIKGSNIEKVRFTAFYGVLEKMAELTFRVTKHKAIFAHYQEVVAVTILCVLFYVSSEFMSENPENFIFLMMLLYRTYHKMASLQGHKRGVVSLIPSYLTCKNLLEYAKGSAEKRGGKECRDLVNGIEGKGISFSYKRGVEVLKHVDIEIKKNSMVAFVGSSGGGKSTLVDLILGLIHPNEGSIEVDGVDLRDCDIESWRSRIGFVNQETILFHTTIKENIQFAKPNATEDEIVRAARLANAHDFILKQEKGYKTVVGERGIKLSGGQKQRIALARALIREPEVMILDEATSALDNESEKRIQASIQQLKGKMTIIVVAHRLSTVENADVIYVLKDGVVAEQGSIEQLERKQGEFAALYHLER